MKKKTFFQCSAIFYVGFILLLILPTASIYLIIKFFLSVFETATWYEWLGLFSAVLILVLFAYILYRMLCMRIVLKEKELYVPQGLGNENSRVQYETHIEYVDVIRIFLTISDKNSIGRTAIWVIAKMPNMVFELKDGTQKIVNVLYYSKKQVVKIIDEVIHRAKILGNEIQSKSGIEILSDFLSSQKNSIRRAFSLHSRIYLVAFGYV